MPSIGFIWGSVQEDAWPLGLIGAFGVAIGLTLLRGVYADRRRGPRTITRLGPSGLQFLASKQWHAFGWDRLVGVTSAKDQDGGHVSLRFTPSPSDPPNIPVQFNLPFGLRTADNNDDLEGTIRLFWARHGTLK